MMTDTKEFILNNSHRCDYCGAQAFVLAEGMSGELLFCGHHYKKHEAALQEWAYKIINELENAK